MGDPGRQKEDRYTSVAVVVTVRFLSDATPAPAGPIHSLHHCAMRYA